MKVEGVDWKSTYFLRITQYGRYSLEVQRFTKPRPKLDFV